MKKKIHIQIDADNISCRFIGSIITYAKEIGSDFYIKVFGNFASRKLRRWNRLIDKMSLGKVCVAGYTEKKNATDSAIIQDSVQLKLNKKLDKLILVSGDGDFITLAKYCHVEQIQFIVIGTERTSRLLKENCDVFFQLS